MRFELQCPLKLADIHNFICLEFFTRLRLSLNEHNFISCLNEHNFMHSIRDCVNLLCSSRLEVESPSPSFMPCHYFRNVCATLLDNLKSFDVNSASFPDCGIVELW